MSNFDDMNVETQLQVAYSVNVQLRDQIDALNRTVWSLEERLRISDEGKEDLKKFYENQMDILRVEHQKSIDAAVSRITKSFEEQIAKLIKERDAALLSAKSWRERTSDACLNEMRARERMATIMVRERRIVSLRRLTMWMLKLRGRKTTVGILASGSPPLMDSDAG